MEFSVSTSQPFEPRHDKTNKVSVRPAKTQISLGICPVSSESLLSAWRNIGPLSTYWAHSEDSDVSLRWAHRSFCWFCCMAAHICERGNTGLQLFPWDSHWTILLQVLQLYISKFSIFKNFLVYHPICMKFAQNSLILSNFHFSIYSFYYFRSFSFKGWINFS